MSLPIDGMNVAGYLRNRTGIGTVARRYIRALRILGLPLALKDLSSLNPIGMEEDRDGSVEFDAEHPYSTNLVCVNAVDYPVFAWYVGEPFLHDRYTIGVWFWELRTFPPEWLDRFQCYDELWAPTSFIASTLAPLSPRPVVPMPVVLSTSETGSRERGRERLGAAPDTFVYLFVFDFRSYVERKNPLALVEAFCNAFAPNDNARLVIKCVNTDFDPAALAALQARARGYPVDIIEGYWSASEMHDLMAACDAFVSLHRSEGLGLGLAEAMGVGKPVIATGWSGNTEYMNVSNSFPVRYKLVELSHDVGPYRAGSVWAEPDVEHATELMRLVHAKRELATERGQAAQRSIQAEFSPQPVAERIAARLEVIARRRASTPALATGAAVEGEPAEQPQPAELRAPGVPPMALETSIYGWPGRLAKRGVAFLLSYHTLYQQQLNQRFSEFMRELELTQHTHRDRLDAHAERLDQLAEALRQTRLDLEQAIVEQSVTDGQRVYLPFFAGATQPIVVLGSAGFEFLRLLIQQGLRGVGVETDARLARRALGSGLPLVQCDACTYLGERPEQSFDGIFAADVVGGLSSEALGELVRLAHTRLRPGGTFIVETVEPDPAALLQHCHRAGFTTARIVYPGVHTYAVVAVA